MFIPRRPSGERGENFIGSFYTSYSPFTASCLLIAIMQSQELDFLQMTVLFDRQVSPNKSRGQRRRARRKTASPRSPDEKPDPEDPEAGCVAVSCRRPTNTVPRVAPVESRLCQTIASGTLKEAFSDASQKEAPGCLSTGGIGRFDLSPPKFVTHRMFYIYNTGRPVPPEEQSVTTVDEASLHQLHRRPPPCRQPQRAVCQPVELV